MKFFRPFLFALSVILFGWLLLSNIDLVNVATSLNESEIHSQVEKVNSFNDLERLKEFTIERINYIEVIRKRFSENALIRIGTLILLAAIQIVLYKSKQNPILSK